jgi:hypothetical protein
MSRWNATLQLLAVQRNPVAGRDVDLLRALNQVPDARHVVQLVERGVEDAADARDERPAVVEILAAVDEVVEDAARRADGGLLVAGHVPRNTEPRRP